MNTSSKHNQESTKRSNSAIHHSYKVALSGEIYLINKSGHYLTTNHRKVPRQLNKENPILIGLEKEFDKFKDLITIIIMIKKKTTHLPDE